MFEQFASILAVAQTYGPSILIGIFAFLYFGVSIAEDSAKLRGVKVTLGSVVWYGWFFGVCTGFIAFAIQSKLAWLP